MNLVQFIYGEDRDTITFIARPNFYEIFITRRLPFRTPVHTICMEVRKLVESTLEAVTTNMYRSLFGSFQLAFECPMHPGKGHLCVVSSKDDNPRIMDCLEDESICNPITMDQEHLAWFDKVYIIHVPYYISTIYKTYNYDACIYSIQSDSSIRIGSTCGLQGCFVLVFLKSNVNFNFNCTILWPRYFSVCGHSACRCTSFLEI